MNKCTLQFEFFSRQLCGLNYMDDFTQNDSIKSFTWICDIFDSYGS